MQASNIAGQSTASSETDQVTATIQQPELDALFDAAARGNADAQSALALNAVQNGVEGRVPMRDALSCAELWARMASATGEPAHVMTLATVLGSRYDHLGNSGLDEGAMAPLLEQYLCLRIAADGGHAAAVASVRLMSDLVAITPAVDAIWADVIAAMPPEADAASPTPPDAGEPAKQPRKPASERKIKVPSKPRARRAKAC